MEADTEDDNIGAGANIDNNDGCGEHQRAYLPLTDSEGKLLPIHFLPASEVELLVSSSSSFHLNLSSGVTYVAVFIVKTNSNLNFLHRLTWKVLLSVKQAACSKCR